MAKDRLLVLVLFFFSDLASQVEEILITCLLLNFFFEFSKSLSVGLRVTWYETWVTLVNITECVRLSLQRVIELCLTFISCQSWTSSTAGRLSCHVAVLF